MENCVINDLFKSRKSFSLNNAAQFERVLRRNVNGITAKFLRHANCEKQMANRTNPASHQKISLDAIAVL